MYIASAGLRMTGMVLFVGVRGVRVLVSKWLPSPECLVNEFFLKSVSFFLFFFLLLLIFYISPFRLSARLVVSRSGLVT